jgi:hypothetical protein
MSTTRTRYRLELDTLDPDSYDKIRELVAELRERFDAEKNGTRYSYAIRGYQYEENFYYPIGMEDDPA